MSAKLFYRLFWKSADFKPKTIWKKMTVRNVPSSIPSTESGKHPSTTNLDYKLATEIFTTGATELTAFGRKYGDAVYFSNVHPWSPW